MAVLILKANSQRAEDWLQDSPKSGVFVVKDGRLTFAEADALDVSVILFRLGFRPSEFRHCTDGGESIKTIQSRLSFQPPSVDANRTEEGGEKQSVPDSQNLRKGVKP